MVVRSGRQASYGRNEREETKVKRNGENAAKGVRNPVIRGSAENRKLIANQPKTRGLTVTPHRLMIRKKRTGG